MCTQAAYVLVCKVARVCTPCLCPQPASPSPPTVSEAVRFKPCLLCRCLALCSVDETYEQVKESESDQILRNKALIIDEIESTVSSSVVSGVGRRASGIAPCLLSSSRH